MDLTNTNTNTNTPTIHNNNNNANASVSDAENETPPHPLSFKSKSKSFTTDHHPPPPSTAVTFKECLKNHAASLGAHALDGCGEFMPSPNSTPSLPTSLTCAACGCHRNFHRRQHDNPTHFLDFHRRRGSPSPSTSPPHPPLPNYSSYAAPHMLLALRTAAPEDHHQVTMHAVATPATPTAIKAENSSGRKRFRTKFSQDQKDKMVSLAEKLGWKMQKSDDSLIEKFCNEIGISRGVLKVWLHNNKSTLGKRDVNSSSSNDRNNNNNNINVKYGRDDDHQPQNVNTTTNGSSSSS